MVGEDISVRLFLDWPSPKWCDTDPIESRFEDPAPTRIDAVHFRVRDSVELDWTRRTFRNLVADNVPASGSGRTARAPMLTTTEMWTHLVDDLPPHALAFYTARRRGTDGSLVNFSTSLPARVDVYELGLVNNAVHRKWIITNPTLDSYDDLDRDPSAMRVLKQELIVLSFTPAQVDLITDEVDKQSGQRPVPRSAC